MPDISDEVFGPIIKATAAYPAPVAGSGSTLSTPTSAVPVNAPPWSAMNSWGPTPMMTGNMGFAEIGQSGLRAFAGWVKEEFLVELQGRQGAQKFREMLDNSPVVGAIMFAITSTMRKVDHRVIPADDSGEAQQAADFVESCMNDMSHSWEDLIVENLSMLGYGYAPHEIVYKRRLGKKPGGKDVQGQPAPSSEYNDGLIGWRRIPLRGQDTILKWFFDPYGGVTGLTQQPWTGQLIDIPIEKMLLFRPSQHKGNPEGRSVLRTSYVPYYFMKRLQEQQAILGERMSGFPVVSVPSILIEAAASGNGAAAAALATFKKMAINLRVDEQMGAVIPSDVWPGQNGPSSQRMYNIELLAPGGGGGGRGNAMFELAITRYSTNIMTSVLADFLTLGHEARGSQSLAVTKVDLFFQAVEGFLNSNASVYNRYALPRLWELNGFDPDLMPTIEPDLAQRVDLDVLSNFVLRVSQAGMPLFPNEELQTFLLDAAGLPDVADPRALQAAGLMDDQLDAKDDQQQARLEAMLNPTPPVAGAVKPAGMGGGSSNMEKILLASIARRMLRQQEPARKRRRHG